MGPNEWDLVDPESPVPPILAAITAPEDDLIHHWHGDSPRPQGPLTKKFKRYWWAWETGRRGRSSPKRRCGGVWTKASGPRFSGYGAA